MKVERVGTSVAFTRKPVGREMQVYSGAVNEGLRLLGKQVDLILHNSSAPSVKSQNTGIGTLFSTTTIKKLIPFLRNHGITGIQQEPNGLRKAFDFSPYAPEASAKNIFMIPLEKLTTEEYGSILSPQTFKKIVADNPTPDTSVTNFNYAKQAYNIALKEAYETFKTQKDSPLKRDFEQFKFEKGKELESDSVFRALSIEYGHDDWRHWDELDRTLYCPAPENKEAATNRLSEIKANHSDDIEFYLFQQMLIEKEIKKSQRLSRENGIKIIGDAPVALPAVEEWKHQPLFLQDKALGCPPDGYAPDGQRWGFKYFIPDYIFNKDGSLGEAGLILRKRYEDYFASCPGGVRIDHIIGCIDPFIYTESQKMNVPHNASRIYSQNGSPYRKHSTEEFANILTKIIIPAAEKYGLSKDDIICENLGDVTPPVREVMKNLGLSGISIGQFDYRGIDAQPHDVIMLGSHDNISFLEYIDNFFRERQTNPDHFYRKTHLLADDTVRRGASDHDIHVHRENIRAEKRNFLEACFTEMFTSPAKRVQIFFTDLFGIPKTYNRPGTVSGNWEVRLQDTFEKDYYNEIKAGKAPNFAQIILNALRHRGLDGGHEKLVKDLETSSRILNE